MTAKMVILATTCGFNNFKRGQIFQFLIPDYMNLVQPLAKLTSFFMKFSSENFFYDFWQTSTFSVPHGLYTRNWLWLLFTCCRWSARNMAWRKDLIGWSSISIFFSFWIKGEKMKLWYKICWQSNLSEIEVSDGRTFENSRFFYIIILWTTPHCASKVFFCFCRLIWSQKCRFFFKNVVSFQKCHFSERNKKSRKFWKFIKKISDENFVKNVVLIASG